LRAVRSPLDDIWAAVALGVLLAAVLSALFIWSL
jgi:hypothetical protein